ncbi:conserved hypothetical protein, partial [Listeria seeligeri FSL S4-171]
ICIGVSIPNLRNNRSLSRITIQQIHIQKSITSSRSKIKFPVICTRKRCNPKRQ